MRAFIGFVIAASMLYSVVLPLAPDLWRDLRIAPGTLKTEPRSYPFLQECDQFLIVLNICDFGFMQVQTKEEETFKYMLFGDIEQFPAPTLLSDVNRRMTTTLGFEAFTNRALAFFVMAGLCLIGLYAVLIGFGRKKRRS